jgi:hypothetical protein
MTLERNLGCVALGLLLLGCGAEPKTTAAPTYPEGPFGTGVGDIVANLRFDGWLDPAAATFDAAAITPIELGSYYDPQGSKGVELVVVNACTVWCVPCKEVRHLPAQAAEFGTSVAVVATLSQDADFMPISTGAMAIWATANDITFPLGADADNKLGAFAVVEAVPNYIVIDARDMRLLGVFEAADPGLWPFVAQKLEQIDATP